MPHRSVVTLPALLAAAASSLMMTGVAPGAEPEAGLGRYFGFEPPRIVVVDPDCGPVIVADFNGNGLNDFAIVNNRKSRIEVHLQRAEPLDDDAMTRGTGVNDLPSSRWYERRDVSVAHRVTALRAHDVDGDGLLDIVYAGQPAEIVVLRQSENGDFSTHTRRRVRGLSAGRKGLEIADVMGDSAPEVLAIVEGRVNVFPLSSDGTLGEPVQLGSGGSARQQLVAFFVEDYTGNGRNDILGVIPEDPAPLRLWLQRSDPADASRGVIGPELRFESPALRETDPVRFPGRAAASIAVIERASRRMVFYDLAQEPIATATAAGAEREVQAEATAFRDGDNKDRSVVIADIDGDGTLDLLATDMRANSLALYRQREGLGLTGPERFGTFREPRSLAVGAWDEPDRLAVFVLSQEERAVGVSAYDASSGRLGFPRPVPIATSGASPVAMAHVALRDGPALAVVVQSRRDHTLEVHRPGGAEAVKIDLTGVIRPPRSMLAADIDHNGFTDIMLFTPGEPMVMVRGVDNPDGHEVLTDRTMPQFGLVQAAGPDNTALLDVSGDGRVELLIADKNFVRACAFDGASGWRVIEQVNESDATTSFTGLAVLDDGAAGAAPVVVASDRANRRLVVMRTEGGAWRIADRMLLSGFDPGAIHAGAFSGDGKANILCLSDDAFGVVRLEGERVTLTEFEAWRSDAEDRLEHEIAVGDLNSDGFVDVVVLDAREQMCQIFTFSAARRLHFATEFKVFQSMLFGRGESRTFEPSTAIIEDLTGNGAADLLLLAHDRVLIYPQMVTSE